MRVYLTKDDLSEIIRSRAVTIILRSRSADYIDLQAQCELINCEIKTPSFVEAWRKMMETYLRPNSLE